VFVAVHNFSHTDCDVTLMLKDDVGQCLIDLFKDQPEKSTSDPACDLHLKGYGHRWLRVT
jgi:hypothetical protein